MATGPLTLQVLKRTPLTILLDSFLLDRSAALCTPKTITHYQYTVGALIDRLLGEDMNDISDITPPHIRAYLVSLQERGLKDTTQHAHARGIKAWLNWLVDEGDLDASPMGKVRMPRLEKRVLPPFSPENIQALLALCSRKTA